MTPAMLNDILRDDEKHVSLSFTNACDSLIGCECASVPWVSFVGLGTQYSLFLTPRSSFVGTHTSAPSTEQGIAVDHDTGRSVLNVKKLEEIRSILQPNHTVGLFDTHSLEEPLSKRRRTAHDRTRRWTEGLDCPNLIVPSSAVQHASSFDGVFLDFVNQGESLGLRLAAVSRVVDNVRSVNAAATIFSHADSVPSLLLLAQCGVTHIECALPWELAAKGIAINLPMSRFAPVDLDDLMINLHSPHYRLSSVPMSSHNCACYSCKRHTRAYVHHLLTVQEMNAEIILAVHNLSTMVQLMRTFRGLEAPERSLFVRFFLTLFSS